MPRINPLQLLTCLNVLLAKNGGILSQAEVKRLAGLMVKYSKKLVSKCIYIQILKCTKTDLLGEFMGAGGWSLVHMWLTDGIRAMNWPLVQEILELLLLCPVDVQRLKINSAPKLVKQLSKEGGSEGVRIYATRLVEQWLNVVKSETKPLGSTDQTNPNPINRINTMDSTLESPSKLSSAASIANNLQSPQVNNAQQRKLSTDSTLMYKIVVKDGIQVLSKIENSGSSTMPSENANSIQKKIEADFEEIADNNNKNEDELDSKSDDKSNKENEKRSKESDKSKDSKSKSKSSSSSGSSSSSSKDKHKSSSHKSSKSSSSSKTSSSSSSVSKSKSSSSSSHHSSKSSSSSSKHKSDKHKSSSNSKSSSSSSSSSSRDKHRDKSSPSKEKEKAEQAEKDKETLSKVLPPHLEKLGKIPKKQRDESSSSSNGSSKTTQPTSITIPSKKASMSIEIRKDTEKAKTVKTYKSQFRSHGLTEEAPPPPSRKNLKKPSSLPLPGTAIPNTFSNSLKRASPPPGEQADKDVSTEKKAKIDISNIQINAVEKPGAIKLIPAKPKPASLVESDMFMDALFASAAPKKDIRKRKRRTSGSKEPSSPSVSPVSVKAAPLKFYQDTLDEKDEIRAEKLTDKLNGDIDDKVARGDGVDDLDDDIPLKKVKEDIEEKCRQQSKEENDEASEDHLSNADDENSGESVKKPPGPGCGPDGPPGVLMLHRRRGPKKKLTWRPQEQLEEVRYFEMDETERVNVTKTFTDMKQMERCGEREAFLARKLNCEDLMVEQTIWKPLIYVDDVPPHPDGSHSREKKIQSEREQTTLKALYFSRAMIPDSASEPELEHCPMTEATVIPLDDITGNPDAINDFMKYGWPEPKGTPPRNLEDLGSNNAIRLLDNDMKFQNGPFNPFIANASGANNNVGGNAPASNGPWQIGVQPQNVLNNLPNNGSVIIPPNLLNNQIVNPFQMGGNAIAPNLLMGLNGINQPMSPSDIKAPLMQHIVNLGGNFNQPNNLMNGPNPIAGLINNNFNNQMMNVNMNNNRNNNRGGNGGNWRSNGQSNNSGNNNWRSGGNNGNNNNQRNWVHGNNNGRGVCKSFMRGFCRNGSKCNYLHPGPNNNNNRI